MSFYLKLVGDEIFYGGMKSIVLDYEVIPAVSIVQSCGKLDRPLRIFAVGGSVQTSYVKGRLGSARLWREKEIEDIAGLQGLKLILIYKDTVRHYTWDGVESHPIVDEFYQFLHGTTQGQVDDALAGIKPTRWECEYSLIAQ